MIAEMPARQKQGYLGWFYARAKELQIKARQLSIYTMDAIWESLLNELM